MNLKPAVEMDGAGRRKYAPRFDTVFKENGDAGVTVESADPISIDDALALAGFNPSAWEIKEVKTGGHVVPMKIESREGVWKHHPVAVWCNKWTVVLKPKHPGLTALRELCDELKKSSPKVPKRKVPKAGKSVPRRALEIDLLDVHLGLVMNNWNMNDTAEMVRSVVDGLLRAAAPYAPFDEIVFPTGNDWSHIDSIFPATTGGTIQPEATSWHDIYRAGLDLYIEVIHTLAQTAPVRVLSVPGNHDRQTAFSMALALECRFHGDKNVTVDSGKAPYKFWRYGTSLVLFEHGHSIKPVRYASLMAAERPQDFAETAWREVHCGDKHRRGSSGQIAFEEFGVGVEFNAGLTPTNEWHSIKSFTHQKRMGTAYVWNRKTGREAILNVRVA